MMKSAFSFLLKALFDLEIFTFLFQLFDYVEKQLNKTAMVNFKIYDVTDGPNKSLQYTYHSMTQGVKLTRQ